MILNTKTQEHHANSEIAERRKLKFTYTQSTQLWRCLEKK